MCMTSKKTAFEFRVPARRARCFGWRAWLLLVAFGMSAKAEPTWSGVRAQIARQWPAVPQMGTAELARQYERPETARPVVIDVRTRREFAVSHLPGALHAETTREILRLLAAQPATRPVVLYCSVGVRSSALAEAVAAAGRPRVYNLQGSVFQWANEGRPLVRDGRPVSVVDPYNASWGRLLDAERHPRPSS